MNFIFSYSLILLISLALTGLLYLLDRFWRQGAAVEIPVHPSIFDFFTTLYAIFLGFALFTLWSAYLTTDRNVTKEADMIFNVYHSSLDLPDSRDFHQTLRKYVTLVIEEEWDRMGTGAMSPAADTLFAQAWHQLRQQRPQDSSSLDLYLHLSALMEEAGSLRLSRGLSLTGNLYRPIWVIIIFGFFTILFGLYFLHVKQTVAHIVFNFMLLFLLLACIYVIYDIDKPFSGTIIVSAEAFRNVLPKMQVLP